jgi:hypothetical protein
MADRREKIRFGLGAAATAICLLMGSGASAADLDHPYYRPVPVAPNPLCLPVPPSCRIVPQPEMNLYNEVTRVGIQRVCISRGVYADSFYPYAPPYWRPNHRQGYGPESDWPW